MRKFLRLLPVTAILILNSCGKKEEQAPPPTGPIPYAVTTITEGDVEIFQEFTANIEGQQNVEIRPKVNGFIQKIYVEEGQQVRKGQLLFKLETDAMNQDAAGAKAVVQAAQVEVDRLKPLVERNIISNVQLETAKARLAQAKSAYGSVAATIGYGTITSPVNGVIGSLPYREGSLVSATSPQPLTTVSDAKNIRAYFTMNEKQLLTFSKTFKGSTMAEKVKNAPAVSLLLVDNTEFNQKGKLAAVNGLIDPTTGTTQFRADFANPDGILRSGSSGVVRLPIIQNNVILVPQGAVFEVQGKQIIYVVGKGNKVESRVVKTNGTKELDFIVVDGLKSGDVVVIEGASKLTDGVEIVPQNRATSATASNLSENK